MLEKVQEDRARKLQAIRELGIDPYGRRYDTAEPIEAVLKRFDAWEKANPPPGAAQGQAGPDAAPRRADAAGRLILLRDMGKMMFGHIRDQSGQMQICLRKDQEGKSPKGLAEDAWKLAKLLDLGDIVAVQGELRRTRTGEVTIWADTLTLLCKSLNPMPEKFHGLQDTQTRYRKRYLDLMTNPGSLETFKKRIAILEIFRSLLAKRGFVEVETPILQAVYGGAAARPFVTHHNTLDADLFLRISPELYLKRLLVGGMGKVFEIGPNFRNEGIDTRHNPEFTMMELYQAYADYEVMMEITEELVACSVRGVCKPDMDFCKEISSAQTEQQELEVIRKFRGTEQAESYEALLGPSTEAQRDPNQELDREALADNAFRRAGRIIRSGGIALRYREQAIDFTPPWRRATYDELMIEHAGVSMKDGPGARAKARALGLEESNKDDAVVVDEVFEAVVEPALAKPDSKGVVYPVFVKDYPAELCPLTRRKSDDPTIALRFECFCAGMELANAYTELNDPAVQEANFRQQLRGEAANETMRVMDEDFVNALRQGMPPAGGLGIGIDRVVMLLTNSTSIRDVVLFPLLRPE